MFALESGRDINVKFNKACQPRHSTARNCSEKRSQTTVRLEDRRQNHIIIVVHKRLDCDLVSGKSYVPRLPYAAKLRPVETFKWREMSREMIHEFNYTKSIDSVITEPLLMNMGTARATNIIEDMVHCLQ